MIEAIIRHKDIDDIHLITGEDLTKLKEETAKYIASKPYLTSDVLVAFEYPDAYDTYRDIKHEIEYEKAYGEELDNWKRRHS